MVSSSIADEMPPCSLPGYPWWPSLGRKTPSSSSLSSSKKRPWSPEGFSTPHTKHMRLTFCAANTVCFISATPRRSSLRHLATRLHGTPRPAARLDPSACWCGGGQTGIFSEQEENFLVDSLCGPDVIQRLGRRLHAALPGWCG